MKEEENKEQEEEGRKALITRTPPEAVLVVGGTEVRELDKKKEQKGISKWGEKDEHRKKPTAVVPVKPTGLVVSQVVVVADVELRMPFILRQVTPVRLSRLPNDGSSTTNSLEVDPRQSISNQTLSACLRQLASLVALASDIFTHCQDEASVLHQRTVQLRQRLDRLQSNADQLDSRSAPIRKYSRCSRGQEVAWTKSTTIKLKYIRRESSSMFRPVQLKNHMCCWYHGFRFRPCQFLLVKDFFHLFIVVVAIVHFFLQEDWPWLTKRNQLFPLCWKTTTDGLGYFFPTIQFLFDTKQSLKCQVIRIKSK